MFLQVTMGQRPGPTVVRLVRSNWSFYLYWFEHDWWWIDWYHVLHVWEAGPLRPQLYQQAGELCRIVVEQRRSQYDPVG